MLAPVIEICIYKFAKIHFMVIFYGFPPHIYKFDEYQYFCAIPVLALVPPLRSPPLSGAGASEFSLACYIACKIIFCAFLFIICALQNLVAVHGTNCWRYSDCGPLKDARDQVRPGDEVE